MKIDEQTQRKISLFLADKPSLRAAYLRLQAQAEPPADAQTVELRVHASSKSSLFVRSCECDDHGCKCEDREFH